MLAGQARGPGCVAAHAGYVVLTAPLLMMLAPFISGCGWSSPAGLRGGRAVDRHLADSDGLLWPGAPVPARAAPWSDSASARGHRGDRRQRRHGSRSGANRRAALGCTRGAFCCGLLGAMHLPEAGHGAWFTVPRFLPHGFAFGVAKFVPPSRSIYLVSHAGGDR